MLFKLQLKVFLESDTMVFLLFFFFIKFFGKDKAVLENHHASAAFKLALEEKNEIFKNFSREDYSKIRERIIGMILATDMSLHFTDIAKLKGRLTTSGI